MIRVSVTNFMILSHSSKADIIIDKKFSKLVDKIRYSIKWKQDQYITFLMLLYR